MAGRPQAMEREEVDLLVVGAGAAGMTAALTASIAGLSVMLVEKTGMVGGTTSTSGGTTWIPGTEQSRIAGVPDSVEDARAFLRSVVGMRGGEELREAFLASGPAAIDELEKHSDVRFTAAPAHPDYLGNHPGAAFGGRALVPDPFDGRLLGADFARLRPPHRVFMGLGGMMVGRNELGQLLKPFASLTNLRTALTLVGRYLRDRLRFSRGTRVLMGNALAARLFYSLKQRGVPILFDSPLRDLVLEGGRVAGAIVEGPLGRRTIMARRGVVLATGGIGWNQALRSKLFPAEAGRRSQAPRAIEGDGICIATTSVPGQLDNGCDSAALWMPCSILRHADGTEDVWPHIILDRAKPGLVAVGRDGRRFVNEADSYHDFCMGMFRSHLGEAWLVVDSDFIRTYGLGLVLPGGRRLRRLLRAGYLVSAPDVAALAARIDVDARGLQKTIEDYNAAALTGEDRAFGRGSTVFNRFNGDPAVEPNPCLSPIRKAPFYALKVVPIDLAGSAGLRCDEDGQVLGPSDAPVGGLYACGNDMTSLFRGTYPGPGTTLGPAIVFGWRVGRHAARRPAARRLEEAADMRENQ